MILDALKEANERASKRRAAGFQERAMKAEAALGASQDESWANWNSFKRVEAELAAIKGDRAELLDALKAVVSDPLAPVNTLAMQKALEVIAKAEAA